MHHKVKVIKNASNGKVKYIIEMLANKT